MTASLSHSNSQIIMSQTAKSLKNESDKRSHVRGRFVFLIGSNQRCSETRNPPGFVWLFKNWTRLLPPLWPAATVWFKGSIYTGNTINISCLLTILCSGISPRSSRRIRLLYRCRVRQRVKTIANIRILCDTDCRCFSQRSLFDSGSQSTARDPPKGHDRNLRGQKMIDRTRRQKNLIYSCCV